MDADHGADASDMNVAENSSAGIQQDTIPCSLKVVISQLLLNAIKVMNRIETK